MKVVVTYNLKEGADITVEAQGATIADATAIAQQAAEAEHGANLGTLIVATAHPCAIGGA